MNEFINVLFVIILILNLFALGNSRILTIIRIVALQGIILGALPLFIEHHITIPLLISSVAAIILKGFVIPLIMMKALRDAQIKREVEPLIGLLPSTIFGGLVTALVFFISSQVETTNQPEVSLLIPTSFATILIGFILLITRYKAISQVLGYLVLENGIYIFSLLLIEAIPMVVEMGMLLDLFVSIFIISIITNHINKAFSSLDTRNLSSLKE
ncbi:MAG: hydrogenase [Spirochaetes bacterium GWF1_31_7]|nr:MAG: hydrogenase [Spirochaetes bacterium GWE1_32_154]OHD46118.1 MAG: hydrogenase [Spirochaetes bacterium GWE2_31_10]OHD47517.1 MAG: hydrogenase [Spirochaetes bacterium GWF1_31_7]OHD83229.1 MAG: hydrogenase [Spirochaetes bacterium RIFOXYB1_FULL_32_8]